MTESRPGSTRETARPRPAARVVLIDSAQRVLLFRAVLEEPGRAPFWITPGGGVKPGERFEDAARREIWEETGLEKFELGPCAWLRDHVFYWAPEQTWYHQQERYFVGRVDAHEVVTRFQEAMEAQFMTSHRWWTLADMRASSERLVPGNLADLFQRLLDEGPPAEPFIVGL
jgi:8-oxo-dGTP pyrophosphatase MutT (NUDIX family)